MGEYNSRNPRKIPGNKRPQRRRKKMEVPGAVIAIYVIMAVLILAICVLVFVITLKRTNSSSNSGDSAVSVEGSSDNSAFGSDTQSSDSSSSDISNGESSQSDISSDGDSSDTSWQSTSSSESTSSETSSSTGQQWLPTTYTEAFFEDDLFIGDSIFTGLSGYGYINAANVAAKIGYTPSGAISSGFDARGISAVDYAKQRQPERIYIMLGSNTMGAGTNFDVIVSQYRELVKELRTWCPKSIICVISIPPVTADSTSAQAGNITNENIRAVNAKLKTMALECGEEYFDLNSMLSDDDGYFMEEYAEQDGLHFKGSTYKVMLSALENEFTP